ncbi:hypothetical protein LL251_08690 [Sphingobium naphthae]|nr:hypothetical protein [Sphingobium naphthae]
MSGPGAQSPEDELQGVEQLVAFSPPLLRRLETVLSNTATSDILPMIELLLQRRAMMEAPRSQDAVANPSIHLLRRWERLSARCYNSLRFAWRNFADETGENGPLLSDVARIPVEELLQIPNFSRASLLELFFVMEEYGHRLRERAILFIPEKNHLRTARSAYAARLAKAARRWKEMSALLDQKEGENLSWQELATLHKRSVKNLRSNLQEHHELRIFLQKNPLPPGRSGIGARCP